MNTQTLTVRPSAYERTVTVELRLSAEFDYTPADRPDTGPEAQYPGAPADVEVTALFLGNVEIPLDAIPDDVMAEIVDDLLTTMAHEDDTLRAMRRSGMPLFGGPAP